MENNSTLEQKVYEILKELKDEAISLENLRSRLEISSIEELTELSNVLISMQQKYKVSTTKKGKYVLFNDPKIKIGKLEVKKRDEDGSLFGFVLVDEMSKDIFINGRNLNGAIDGEIVRVDIIGGRKDRPEGEITEIVERKKLDNLVGQVIVDEQGVMKVKLDDKRMDLDLYIPVNPLKAVAGHKVVVEIKRDEVTKDKKNKKEPKSDKYIGNITQIIGHINEPGVDVKSIGYAHGFSEIFTPETLEQLKRTPDHVLPEEYKGRRDLRDEIIFTIDGDDTKDIDDAVNVKKLPNGNFFVGVHIADVSHYVPTNSAIDKDAYRRTTSVYMVNTVMPMLPAQLSNGICSLNPNVDRLALSCDMEIDANGKIVNYDIYESVINSKKQMTYGNVNKILEENIIPEGYETYAENLKLMNHVALILRKNKLQRGMIEFASKEVKFKFDENNIPIEIVKREQRSGEKLIEDFMIIANETIATHMTNLGYPSVYRVHGTPEEEKVDDLVGLVIGLGIEIPNKKKKYNLFPKAFQELMNLIKTDPKVFKIVSQLALRTQKKAVYTSFNEGHFGLASENYTHFTSPIRRYPDKILHELVKLSTVKKDFSHKTIAALEEKLVYVCEHCSLMEREAEKCEREADDLKTAELMSYHIGEQFHGMVTGVIKDALFVELSNNAEGRLHISELTDDNYVFNAELFRLEGQSTGKTYSYGDELDIVVKNASKETMRVDFEMYQPLKEEVVQVKKN